MPYTIKSTRGCDKLVDDSNLRFDIKSDCDFNTKVKCLLTLAFILPPDIIDGIIELVDGDDLLQELAAYPETHYIGGEKGMGPCRRKVPHTFAIGLWNMYERTYKVLSEVMIEFKNIIYEKLL